MGRKTIGLAVLLSGTGRTLTNILEVIESGDLTAEVKVVVSDRPDVYGLKVASDAEIPNFVVKPKDYGFTEEFSKAVTYKIEPYAVDLVLMAGFLSLYKIPRKYEHRVMNIHPALIPSFAGKGFYGHHVHEAAIKSGCKVSGCTVHFANNLYDSGPIISQKVTPILFEDTPDSLAERVFELECQAYPEAIQLFADERLQLVKNRVKILDRDKERSTSVD